MPESGTGTGTGTGTNTTPAVQVVTVDPVESVRAEVLRRLVTSGVFALESIQRENGPEPDTVPYCRLTVAQSAEYIYDTQTRMSKTVIAEIDILTRGMTQTQEAGQLAQKVEAAFGIYARAGSQREITLPGWSGMRAHVEKFGRGTATVESGRGLYYLPVLLYVELEAVSGAHYEVS